MPQIMLRMERSQSIDVKPVNCVQKEESQRENHVYLLLLRPMVNPYPKGNRGW
jgi:hypothetical protein